MSSIKRDQVWQRPNIELRQLQIRNEVNARIAATGISAVVEGLPLNLSSNNYKRQLKYFLTLFEILRSETISGLDLFIAERIFYSCKKLLSKANVNLGRSVHSPLVGELYFAMARIYKIQKKKRQAHWYQLLAHKYDSHFAAAPEYALYEWHNPSDSSNTFNELTEPGLTCFPDDQNIMVKLKSSRYHRLMGDPLLALAEINDGLLEKFPNACYKQFRWEKILARAQLTHNLTEMNGFIAKESSEAIISVLHGKLWNLAVRSRSWIHVGPRSTWLLDRYADTSNAETNNTLKIIESIARCYAAEDQMWKRLEDLGNALSGLEQIKNTETYLLVLAAASRWLLRSRNRPFMKFTLEEYYRTCQKVSSGRSNDIYRFFDI